MSIFNPKILDASLRDVTGSLPDEQKADVLLFAMERLRIDRSVVQSHRIICTGPYKPCIFCAVLAHAIITYVMHGQLENPHRECSPVVPTRV